MGISANGALSLGFNGSIPEVDIANKTTAIDFDFKFGKEDFPLFSVSRLGKWSGNFQWSKLENDGHISNPGYGYLHTEKAGEDGLKDFNRMNMPYSKKVPNLAPSFYTYDLLSVSGQGVGGMFRPFRSKVDVLSTPTRINKTNGFKLTVELGTEDPPVPGPPFEFHFGLGYAQTKAGTYSGIWQEDDNGDNGIHTDIDDSCVGCEEGTGYQTSSYNLFGEQSGRFSSDLDQLNVWGSGDAVRVGLSKKHLTNVWNNSWETTNDFIDGNNPTPSGPEVQTSDNGYGSRVQRTPKANNIQTLNAKEAYHFGFSKDLEYYEGTNPSPVSKFTTEPADTSEKISELIVTKADGLRYGYGLPAMNKKQVDATFNVFPDPTYTNVDGGTVNTYDANVDAIMESGHTTNASSNQYSSKTTLPEYAHSWLLTHIVSPDYADIDSNGFSPNDPGSWMKFEYRKISDAYQWREPYKGASFMQGLKSDPRDDMAAYSYGEKELYYLYRVETATHIAIFETSERNDAVGALNEQDGGYGGLVSNNKMHKLDRIQLYAKPNGIIPDLSLTIPLQTVHFDYSYSLYPGIPSSNSGGKLTLKEVYVTTDNSFRGELSPYVFEYDTTTVTNYDRQDRDRWGNYQDNGSYGDHYSFVDFPYTDQYGSPKADVCQLKKVTLPTGGVINIEYESDDYAYEMDKPAVQMFDIIGTEDTSPDTGNPDDRYKDGSPKPALLTGDEIDGFKIYVKLTTPIPSGVDQRQYFRDHYIGDIKKLYFKTLCQLKDGSSTSQQDYVAGYANLLLDPNPTKDYYGVDENYSDIAYITVEAVKIQKISYGQKIHPIRKASIEHLRANRPKLIYSYFQGDPQPDDVLGQIAGTLGSMMTAIQDVATIFMGINAYGVANGWSKNIYLNGHSVIRLQNGNGFMYGGGNRVRSISINNGWTGNQGLDDEIETYGQQFDYTIRENGRTISSGVAITPQDAGGDECALLEPVDYRTSSLLVSPFHLFVEKPVMRHYYPGAGVGYRQVTVRSFADNIEKTKNIEIDDGFAPVTIHECYSHKDFPVIESQTDLTSDAPVYRLGYYIIGGRVEKKIGRSQGYTVELNNMAGVQKSITQMTYPTDTLSDGTLDYSSGTLISKSEYIYNTTTGYNDNGPNRLSSSAKIVDGNGEIVDGVIGETYDIFHDFHENASYSKRFGAELNLDILIAPPVPFPFFTIFPIPEVSISSTSVRTAVTHKIIYRTGLLNKVNVTDGLSTITTKNIAYDRITAQPVLTRTTNEFHDFIYSMSEPAHKHYDGMAGAYQNLGVTVTAEDGAGSGIVDLDTGDGAYFSKGDEVWVEDPTGDDDPFMMYVTGGEPGQIHCREWDGSLVAWSGIRELTVVRSGHRNILNASAGNSSFLGKSSESDSIHLVNRNLNILNTAANTFDDNWHGEYCDDYWMDTQCSSPLTQTAMDLENLLNEIANNDNPSPPCKEGVLEAQSLKFCSPGFLKPTITNSVCRLSASANMISFFYRPQILQDSNLLMNFILTYNDAHIFDSCECSITLATPTTGFDWGTVTGFSNIQTGSGPYDFSIKITTTNGNFTVASAGNQCFIISTCDPNSYVVDSCTAPATTNPYVLGEKGNWRPYESYAFKIDRDYKNDEPVLREYGTYSSFSPYEWDEPSSTNEANGWVLATRVTKYSPHGNVLEEQDALGNYSAAQFGYLKQLAVAVCNNALYQEIGFANFEEANEDCQDHFSFYTEPPNNRDSTQSHTGKFSMEVYAGSMSPYMIKSLTQNPVPTGDNCLPTFSPVATANGATENSKYVVSAWVKQTDNQGSGTRKTTEYGNAKVNIDLTGNVATPMSFSFAPSGDIIDGWQRVFGIFEVPEVNTGDPSFFEIRLVNDASNGDIVYFDDVRVHPFNGNMRSFVYDPDTYRLMATLDENNFATFYIRDQEGQVVKYNVETEKGVVTIQEGTKHIAPLD